MSKRSQDFVDILNRFCLDIFPYESLAEVPVLPEPGAMTGFCVQNVASKTFRDGGEALAGWDITWEEDGLLEAECHVVWCSPDSTLIDMTPRASGVPVTLFLPQPGLWDGTQFVPNKRQAMADTQRCRALMMLAEMQDGRKRESWNGSQWFLTEKEDLEIKARAAKIALGVDKRQKCPCGFPIAFGRCCGRPTGRPWRNFRSFTKKAAA